MVDAISGFLNWETGATVLPLLDLVFALAIVFLERRNVSTTWAWILVMAFLPVVGFILYLFLGQNLARKRVYKMERYMAERFQTLARDQARLLSDPDHRDREASVYLHDFGSLMHLNLQSNFSFLSRNNEVRVFTTGKEKFDHLFQAIAEAREHIHLLYYMIKKDRVGTALLNLLEKKAREGVEVRIIYDHVGSGGLSKKAFRKVTRAGGEVRPFFPSRIPYLNLRINYRNHRKIAVIDGKIGFIGGFNIGDEYLGLDPKLGFWRDTHLAVEGNAVYRLQAQFFLDWNAASNQEIELPDRYFPDIETSGQTTIQIVSSGPHSNLAHIKNAYLKLIYAAKESIYLQTPYFVPDDDVMNALRIAALSGVDVRIMFPRKADHWIVHIASLSYLGELLEAGVTCHLYENGFLHAKTIVVDGAVGVVGTCNIDHRSFHLNFEIGAFLYDKLEAEKLKQIFEADLASCSTFTFQDYAARSPLSKFGESLARLLSPLL
ncbi:cardiolipin synthase [Tumebacillus flagellatus]|uniref:Cardiolipin synthase n=1 Tax=Tumebacillus flagellatus TaxID=1157490 RepID=A0A074LVB5_9BACL|nr:cardiolipin synthase [Tumebacillus flagellatus]KEO84909.1 phospholipase D [Tumebacillus flagellatus]